MTKIGNENVEALPVGVTHFCICGHAINDHAHHPRLTVEDIDHFVSKIRDEKRRESKRAEMLERQRTKRTQYHECRKCACRWYIYDPPRHEETTTGFRHTIFVGRGS